MPCNWSDFKLDCSRLDCEKPFRDCLDKVKKLEGQCQTELNDLKKSCAKKTLTQGGIWGAAGAAATGIGLLLSSTGVGLLGGLGLMAIGGGIGAAAGGASKADDCADEIRKKKDECADKMTNARDGCAKERETCNRRRRCCDVWNELMDDLLFDDPERDCAGAYAHGFVSLKNDGCDDMLNEFKDVWAKCCKE